MSGHLPTCDPPCEDHPLCRHRAPSHEVREPATHWVCEHCGDPAQRGHVCEAAPEFPYSTEEPTC